MKDFKRIERICNKIQKLWSLAPDVRLFQLLDTFLYNEADAMILGKAYFFEDDKLEEKLDSLLQSVLEENIV